MHIPENYLSPQTCGVLDVAMVPILAYAAKKVRETVPRERMPLLGVAAAFCFLAMMFNIPLPGGTTGHAVCGTLVAILFGPWAAVIAITVALAIQAVLFGDGGVLALGANCFNMAFVLPMVGYYLYSFLKGKMKGLGGELVAAGVASYVALNCAALLTALEFGIQPLLFTDASGAALYCPYPVSVAVPAMMIGHLSIAGIAEVIFTVAILAFVRRTSPAFGLQQPDAPTGARALAPVLAVVAALVVATPLGLIAEGDAWGEWAVEDLAGMVGYTPAGLAGGWEWQAMFPDYAIGGLPDAAGYILSAVIGVALLVIVFRLLAFAVKPRVHFGAA